MLRTRTASEQELLRAVECVQHGDADAFAAIYNHYICEVLEHCRRQLCWLDRNTGYEEDIANEVMVSLWRSLRANCDKTLTLDQLRHVIRRSIFEHCANRGKFNKRRKRSSEGYQSTLSLHLCQHEVATTDVAVVEVKDFLQFVSHSIADRESRTFVSLKIKGFSNNQIAHKCGISSRTVRRKLHAAWRFIESQISS